MGILDDVFEIRGKNSGDDFWYAPIGHSVASKAGVQVSNETAMRCAPVYASVKVLGESVGSLPCHLYERKERGRDRAVDHWGYDLMHRQTGPRTPACAWVETAVYHMALTGNHYSVIDWNNSGGVNQLFPLNPTRVEVETTARGLVNYKYQDDKGKEYVYPEAQILHVPAFSWDGITGISPIGYARETLGLTIATEEFGARFFANGTNMGTIYTLPEGKRLGDEEKTKLTEDLRASHGGLAKAHQAVVLPAGMTATKVAIPPDDAQWIEARKLNKADVASIFRVPLHMIQEHEKSTSWGTGIEQMTMGFVSYTLRPWLIRIEQMLNLKLLRGTDRERFYFEFLVDALMRGDQKTRGEFYSMMVTNQVMTPNEVREKENMNPIEGGDEVIKPENLFGKSQDAPPKENDDTEEKARCECGQEHDIRDNIVINSRAEPDPDLDHPRMSIQRSYRRVIRDAMARVIRRERNDIMAFAKKAQRKRVTMGEKRNAALTDFIAEFYREHEEFTRAAIRPAFTALAEAIGAEAMREIQQKWEWNDELEEWLEEYIAAFANRHSNQSRGQLLQLLDELEEETGAAVDETAVIDGLGQRFEEWEVGLDGAKPRDDKIGARESVRLGNGLAAFAFFAAGVGALVWRATGSETCPYCTSLNGKTVRQGVSFVSSGEDFTPNGAEPLRPRSNISHPPLHAGCDCLIVPE